MPPAPIRVGLQIPNFNLPGTEPAQLLEKLTAIARTAETSGFDSIYVITCENGHWGVKARSSFAP